LRRAVADSREMAAFRAALAPPGGGDTRAGVIDDLATYYGIGTEECVARCLDWEQESVREWHAEDRATDEARLRFYQTTSSWSFDLMWWAYLQAEGFGEPQGVTAAWWAGRHCTGRRHLDFGSGTGTTSQVFLATGFSSELADVSSSLLDFARFRLERRGENAGYRDLSRGADLGGPYDVITAIDALAHVPDIRATTAMLHAALSPGGALLAGIDARPASAENAWHLQDDELGARYVLQRVGFRPERRLGNQLIAYRKVEPGSIGHRMRAVPEWALLGSPACRAAQRHTRALTGRIAAYRRSRHGALGGRG
jgi:2-polyprenyl-3-methyl-5-hydroxy-6-metoxy-1,4-benzoquinol methylase